MRSLPALSPKQWVLLGVLAYTGLALGVTLTVPMPIDPEKDFFAIHAASRMWLAGVSIYDPAAQLAWKLATYGEVILTAPYLSAPYFYPPWYFLALAFVGYLPIQVGAQVFFFINLGWLVFLAALVLPVHTPVSVAAFKMVLANVVWAVLFVPSIAILFLGQYTLPVVVGSALFIYAAQHHRPWGMAGGLALMTFKPHLGLPMLIVAGLWLVHQRRWDVLARALGIAVALVLVGFLADPNWVGNYLLALTSVQPRGEIRVCETCLNLALESVQWLTGKPALDVALPWVLGSAVLWLGVLVVAHLRRPLSATAMIHHAALLAVLANPYLGLYDYVILLPALAWLSQQGEKWALIPYFAPWTVFILGRDVGDMVLLVLLVLGTVLLLVRHNSLPAFLGNSAVD